MAKFGRLVAAGGGFLAMRSGLAAIDSQCERNVTAHGMINRIVMALQAAERGPGGALFALRRMRLAAPPACKRARA